MGVRPSLVASVPGGSASDCKWTGDERIFTATEKLLGEGAYGKVYVGQNSVTREPVAIKLITSRKSVQREVSAMQRAGRHPNVVSLLSYFHFSATTDALVMELCSGKTLFDHICGQGGALDEAEARPILAGILAGLTHLHSRGIAHLDLKLENVLVHADRNSDEGDDHRRMPLVKIIDLGHAHKHERRADGTGWEPAELVDFRVGSRSYRAPEVSSRRAYDGYRADVWSLGVCAFGMVSGFFPVDQATKSDFRYATLVQLQNKDKARAGSSAPSSTASLYGLYGRACHLSTPLLELIDSMLCVDPAQRANLKALADASWLTARAYIATK